MPSTRQPLEEQLWALAAARGARLFSIIDCAADDEVLRVLAAHEQPYRSLFAGELERYMVARR